MYTCTLTQLDQRITSIHAISSVWFPGLFSKLLLRLLGDCLTGGWIRAGRLNTLCTCLKMYATTSVNYGDSSGSHIEKDLPENIAVCSGCPNIIMGTIESERSQHIRSLSGRNSACSHLLWPRGMPAEHPGNLGCVGFRWYRSGSWGRLWAVKWFVLNNAQPGFS